eukprot:scaffold19230_cov154-Skeletonema_menzelii.AAC.2
MPSVYKGAGCHPSKSCAEAPADMIVDDVDVDMETEEADAPDDVNIVKVTEIEDDDDGDGDDDGNDDDAHYRMLIREKEQEEEKLIDDTVALEEAAIPEDALGEMIGPTHATEEQLKQMRSMYVADEKGVLHHKRTLLNLINKGKGLGKKSHDREKRARGDARHGNGTRQKSDSCVKRAFRFAHDHSDIDSGTNHHAPGDFCCVLVEGSTKSAHMVIAKFVRFGNINNNVPLELSWPIEQLSFKATVEVISIDAYSNIDQEACIRSTGRILVTLRSVHSDCITPITPSLEEAEVDGKSITHAVMKLSELKTLFCEMACNVTRFHKLTKKINLPPIEVEGDAPFVVTNRVSELPVCSICQPSMRIGRQNCEKHELQRYLRNHAASHFWSSSIEGEPCGLCCKAGCSTRLSVHITKGDVKKILENGARISPSSIVSHGCQTFLDVKPFEFKWCNKAISGFPCLNMPVICHACTADYSIPTFLWSYNIENHYNMQHGSFTGEERKKYESYITDAAEKEQVRKNFPIN